MFSLTKSPLKVYLLLVAFILLVGAVFLYQNYQAELARQQQIFDYNKSMVDLCDKLSSCNLVDAEGNDIPEEELDTYR